MFKYLKIQEAPITDNITADGHVGSKLPWPVTAGEDAVVVVPSSYGMKRVIGFQRDLAGQQVDVWWNEAFTDPTKIVGMYMVTEALDGRYPSGLSAVDSAEFLETEHEIPVER